MSSVQEPHLHLGVGHILFLDIVGYSKLLSDEQKELVQELNQIVRQTEQFRAAEAEGKLTRLPTGDGMVLVFTNNPEAPVECALEISKALQSHPKLKVRMGIHSGPVNPVADVNDQSNLLGAGINVAQRVMYCGDAGHILLSKHFAEDLEHYAHWRSHLHDVGQAIDKHGLKVLLVNLYTDQLGNAALPTKLRRAKAAFRLKSAGVAALLLIMALGAGFWMLRRSQEKLINEAAAIPSKSIAVLPFENLSEEKANAFFAGGVQDEILTDLAKIADLKVISRTSVMKYKSGPERNLRDIATALGVSYVVEGSVQRAGERVRVSAQLIDARSDTHLWAEHYDRDVADVFAIQTEIAERIADQLRAKLSAGEKAAIAERPTTDLVAYAYYTKAKALDLSADQKVELLEKATQRDPNFVLAYCALAKAHDDLWDGTEGNRHIELAKRAADAALRLRPDSSEAHLELARYYFDVAASTGTNDYDRAREELAIVRRKLPNNSEALVIEGMIDRHQNRWDASLANCQKANELDPRNDDVAVRLRLTYFEMRRYSQLEQFIRKQAPGGDPLLGYFLWTARIKLAQGDPVAAQSLLEQVPLEFSPGNVIWEIRFKTALCLRDYDAANRVIAATPEKYADDTFGGPSGWAEGQIARARGDKQKAQEAFAAAREKLEAQQGDKPKDVNYFADVAKLDAGLGRKEEAIGEAQRAVELMPITEDSLNGPRLVANLALVYAWTGERDRALEQLEKIATLPGLTPTYGDLRFNPCWDDLRGDKRFDKIVAAAKAANR